jgi:hypothetical protein
MSAFKAEPNLLAGFVGMGGLLVGVLVVVGLAPDRGCEFELEEVSSPKSFNILLLFSFVAAALA